MTAVEADLALFLQDATSERFLFSPGQSVAFPVPVIGVVTKTDIATKEQVAQAVELLELAGAEKVFCVSSVSGSGMEALVQYLSD